MQRHVQGRRIALRRGQPQSFLVQRRLRCFLGCLCTGIGVLLLIADDVGTLPGDVPIFLECGLRFFLPQGKGQFSSRYLSAVRDHQLHGAVVVSQPFVVRTLLLRYSVLQLGNRVTGERKRKGAHTE